MKIENMLIKIQNEEVKLFNLKTGEEGIIDFNVLGILKSIVKKIKYSLLDEKEKELIKEMKEWLGLNCIDGTGEIIVRKGKLENLEISPTKNCNLICKHCCNESGHNQVSDNEIDFDELKNAINESIGMGLYKLNFIGGEPFVYTKINELIKLINTINVKTTIITNGILLDNYLDKLNNNRVSFIISLDGFEESHEFLRGKNTYNKTIKNIEYAIQKNFDVEINMVVYKKNISEIENFSNYLKELGVSKLNIQVLRPVGRGADLKEEIICDEEFLRFIHQNELDNQRKKIENNSPFCTACKTGLKIDYNGNVYECEFLSTNSVGNINKTSLNTIYKNAVKNSEIFNIKNNIECYNCKLFMRLCAGGCRARAKKIIGSIDKCDYWIPFLLNDSKFKKSNKNANDFLLI